MGDSVMIAQRMPYVLEMEPGKYYWCRCGPLQDATLLRWVTHGHGTFPGGSRTHREKTSRMVWM